MANAKRTFQGMRHVHRGKLVTLVGTRRASANAQFVVLMILLLLADGDTGVVGKDGAGVTLVDIGSVYLGEDTVEKALRQLRKQGWLLELREKDGEFFIKIAPSVYDAVAPPTNAVSLPPSNAVSLPPSNPGPLPPSNPGPLPPSNPGPLPPSTPYRSTTSIQADDHGRQIGRDDPGRLLGRDDPGRLLGSGNRSGEVKGIMEAFDRFYREGDPLRGQHAPFIDVLRQASPETIRSLDPSFKARIPSRIWEQSKFPRELWERQSTFVPPQPSNTSQPSTHDLY